MPQLCQPRVTNTSTWSHITAIIPTDRLPSRAPTGRFTIYLLCAVHDGRFSWSPQRQRLCLSRLKLPELCLQDWSPHASLGVDTHVCHNAVLVRLLLASSNRHHEHRQYRFAVSAYPVDSRTPWRCPRPQCWGYAPWRRTAIGDHQDALRHELSLHAACPTKVWSACRPAAVSWVAPG